MLMTKLSQHVFLACNHSHCQATAGTELPEPERRIPVVLMFLDNISEFQVLYDAIRVSVGEYWPAPFGSPNPDPPIAMRCFLGLESPDEEAHVLDVALEFIPPERDVLVVQAESLLKMSLTQEQKTVLLGVRSPVTVIKGVAGSGKTQVLFAILAKLLRKPEACRSLPGGSNVSKSGATLPCNSALLRR